MADGSRNGNAPPGMLSGAATRIGIALSTFSAWWNKKAPFDLFVHAEKIRGLRYSNPRLQSIIANYDPSITPGLLPVAQRRLAAGAQALKQRITMVLRLAQYSRYYTAQRALGPASQAFLESKQNLMKDVFLYLVAEAEKQAAEAALQNALPGLVPSNSQAVGEEGLFGGERSVHVLPWQVVEALNAFISMEPTLASQYGISPGAGVRESAEMPYFTATADAETSAELQAAMAGIRIHMMPGNAGRTLAQAAQAIIEERRGAIFGNASAPPLSAEERAARGLGSGRGIRNAGLALLANRPAGGAPASAPNTPVAEAEAVAALTSLADAVSEEGEELDEGAGNRSKMLRGANAANTSSAGRLNGRAAEVRPIMRELAPRKRNRSNFNSDEEGGGAAGGGRGLIGGARRRSHRKTRRVHKKSRSARTHRRRSTRTRH